MDVPQFFKKQTITQAALLISIILFLSKFIGFAREVLVAKYFGATALTDAFLVALIIPTLILGLFSGGFSTLIIPLYIEKKASSTEEARRFVNSSFLVWGTLFLFISVLVFVFAPLCVKIIAYGFKGGTFALAVNFTRYLVIVGLFTVLTGLFTGLLQAEKQFFFPALAGLLGNFALVLSLFLLHRQLGIHSWTAGQIAFASFQFLALLSLLYLRYNLFHSLKPDQIDWKEMKNFALLLLPFVISGGISILNQIVDKTIASGLEPGSIAALNFAQRVWGVPITLLATPIAMAVFPYFSELALDTSAQKVYEEQVNKTLGMCFYLIVPSSFFLFFLSEPIVRLFFERGAFGPEATALTSFVVKMYVLGLFAHAISPVLARVFYSFKNTRTPLLVSALCVGLNIILNIILAKLLGAGGIALATSIVMLVNIILFGYYLKRYLRPFSKSLVLEVAKMIACSLPIGIICLLARPLFLDMEAATLNGFITLLIRIVGVSLTGLAGFALLSYLFKLPYYFLFKNYALSALRRVSGK